MNILIEDAKRNLDKLTLSLSDYIQHENFDDLEKTYQQIKEIRTNVGKHLSKERVRLTREGKLKKKERE